ncbi:hypothetical protein C1893_19180 [Pseudomonas sp. MPR-ANC1]|uniref:hypothetical protein n=1 Tax=Pseudomonas sp. MPR-ANC1 TaxID=2075548 RepID=UPI000CD1F140|nr:hypothetical protein [Pseudomonas sp. MPR-ANC1]POA46666.1 hypothetical protein C1893_19180 [Pseudomonas sp. MPR-ANC1]
MSGPDLNIVLPARRVLWWRLGTLPMFSHYNRLVVLVLACNIAVLVYGIKAGQWWSTAGADLQTLSGLVVANLSLAILIRQQYLINLLFWLATRAPTSWPLAIRRTLAKVFHFGGLHSGGAMAAIAWFALLFGSMLWQRFQGPGGVSLTLIGVSGGLLGLMLLVAIMAMPAIRGRFHNAFERTHRFAGWAALAMFWAMTLVSAREQNPTAAMMDVLSVSASFWVLLLVTFSIALPWLHLRKVPVSLVRPSSHAVIAHFSHHTPFAGSATAISRNPLWEWHSFANIPAPGQDGFRLIISRAGDWTGAFIEQAPTHVWVKGITTAGVAHIETLFKSVVYIATGSGIGPVLPHLLARQVPIRLIWSTRSPRATYGDPLVDEILEAQPDALIWDTDVRGKPDLVTLAYTAVQSFGAEAVICISNQTLTERVVEEMEARGIPAYGAIWDS